jgi:hypothetical protein
MAFVGSGVILLMCGGLLVWPYVRDDLVLDRVVQAVALDWRDFGRERAQSRLLYEFDHGEVGMHVRDEDCALSVSEAGLRQVQCDWSVEVEIPGTGMAFPLRFRSVAGLDENGGLR